MKTHVPNRVSLIVSIADNPSALDLVLEALSLQTRMPAEILFADDGSDEQSQKVIEKWRHRLSCRLERFWFPHEFYRRSMALNAVVRSSTGDYLVFMDGDCVPHRRFVADHVRHAERGMFVQGRRAGIRARHVRRLSVRHVHPLRLFFQGQLYGLSRGVRRPWAKVRFDPHCIIQGSNFAVWRDDFFRINGYDEAIVGHSHADTEVAARLSNAGVGCKKVVGQLIQYHLDHPRIVRYLTSSNDRILEQTRREKRTRCEMGVTVSRPPSPDSSAALAV